jgi:hypothetical protein
MTAATHEDVLLHRTHRTCHNYTRNVVWKNEHGYCHTNLPTYHVVRIPRDEIIRGIRLHAKRIQHILIASGRSSKIVIDQGLEGSIFCYTDSNSVDCNSLLIRLHCRWIPVGVRLPIENKSGRGASWSWRRRLQVLSILQNTAFLLPCSRGTFPRPRTEGRHTYDTHVVCLIQWCV